MLFGETVAVYCDNHTEHTHTLCGQNAELWYVKAGGTYSNHRALKGLILLREIIYVYSESLAELFNVMAHVATSL
jgi:hypothetical protein